MSLSPAARAQFCFTLLPRVALAEPRSTLGWYAFACFAGSEPCANQENLAKQEVGGLLYREERLMQRSLVAGTYTVKRLITYRVFLPVFVVEVPPLSFVDRESICFHRGTKQITVPSLK